jgi:hypothetical protein
MRIAWRKSSYSGPNGGACVEVADLGGAIGIRDSKAPRSPRLDIGRGDFRRLAKAIKNI